MRSPRGGVSLQASGRSRQIRRGLAGRGLQLFGVGGQGSHSGLEALDALVDALDLSDVSRERGVLVDELAGYPLEGADGVGELRVPRGRDAVDVLEQLELARGGAQLGGRELGDSVEDSAGLGGEPVLPG